MSFLRMLLSGLVGVAWLSATFSPSLLVIYYMRSPISLPIAGIVGMVSMVLAECGRLHFVRWLEKRIERDAP